MCVHLVGAISSPSSSNYVLRKAAVDNSSCYGNDAAAAIMKNFYVNDLLKSVEDEEYAKDLIRRIKKMCSAGGFNLTKFINNNKLVLMSIPENHRREGVKDVDLVNEELPTERILGVHWNLEKDQLCFKLNLKAGNITRRCVLSTLSSFYDTLRLAPTFIFKSRKILQDLCQEGLQRDETVSEMYQRKWEPWENDLIGLEKVVLKRCIKPGGFGKIVHISLHKFLDASELVMKRAAT